MVLTASDDGTAKLWSAETGDCLRTFSGHGRFVKSAAFSADGASVLTASSDGTAKLWSAETGDCRRTFSGHGDAVWSAALSGDGA